MNGMIDDMKWKISLFCKVVKSEWKEAKLRARIMIRKAEMRHYEKIIRGLGKDE